LTDVLQFGLLGLGLGTIYVLIAQGIVLIYRASGVLNFAQGAFVMVGAYVWYELDANGLPSAVSIVLGCAAAGAAGAATQLLVMRPLRETSPVTRLVATLGILTALQGAALLIYSDSVKFVTALLPSEKWHLGDATVDSSRIYLLAIAVVVTAIVWAVMRFTLFGVATTAVAENERVAAAAGRSPLAVATANWAIGGALAGLAGILVIPIVGLSVATLALLVVPGLAAALVGRFGSFPLTLAGGLAIGIGQSEVTRYVSAPGWATAVPLLVIVVILFVNGNALPIRSMLVERMPEVGVGTVRPRPFAALVLLGVAICLLLPADWLLPFTFTLATALLALSLVVVTGYAGQLTLGQYAMAGIGALIASRLSDAAGAPFLVALAVGVLATVPLAFLFALPIMRSRGVSLTVVTLGLGVAIQQVVLGNSAYTGGADGTEVGTPSLLGLSIDPVEHPSRYAIFALAVLCGALLIVANVRRGRAGRRLLAVRGNERAAAALGISVAGAKLYAFSLGGALAAVGGILLAFRTPHVDFSVFNTQNSLLLVVGTVIGGVGFLAGAGFGGLLVGGGIATYASAEWLGGAAYLPLVTGVILTVNVIVAPDGATRQALDAFGRLRRGRLAVHRRRYRVDDQPSAVARGDRVLTVRDLAVRFGAVRALDGLTFDVREGEILGLIGPNGAGKTTAIDAIAGMVATDRGNVAFAGASLDRLAPHRRARAGVGRSFQSLELFEDLTVLENIAAACDRRDRRAYLLDLIRPGQLTISSAAAAAIDELGLRDELYSKPNKLSYGHRRLAAIARALAAAPAILLLDEPAAGLDPKERAELGSLLKRLAREWGIGIVLVEHDVGLVMSTCDRVVVLNFGQTIAEGPPQAVRDDPEVIAAYLGMEADSATVQAVVTATHEQV
jgi:ABC-type branched-subunit amino acid transport system ATPase component/branched-subunit amino acid ABC-type transport system permease component